ncbi:amino acid adenylation domain-containing protein [Streptosporangium subroseum]|uniref:amino acid adenylation domain-containing protein n=1 Tax=Streptosporangium subroseum TaxID=106412 RepID=UPI00308C027E|nr:amino acid adenylation domain-containing protein [Streptosporangium subroseum]
MFEPEIISPRQPAAEYPLSYGQQRLWFLHRFDPSDPSYNTSYVYKLKGRLDTVALEAAFTAVAARHESLRTRFREVAGEPLAIVDPPSPVTLERLTAPDEKEAFALVSTLTNAAFDLAAAPPFRVSLIEIGPDEHVLCVVLHHINGDGWSLNILRTEVATHYGSRGTAPLPDLPLQYGEHTRLLHSSGSELRELQWWAGQLAGVPPLELPTDRPRPARRTSAGSEVEFQIDADLAAAIGALGRRTRCTPYMVLLSAYQVMLSRHTGQTDFCVGTPSAGRGSTELETMIGFLSTTLVLRCDLSGDPTFGDLLKRTRKVVLNALSRQDVPFERLVAELDMERDLSRTPLFQTLFAFHTHGDATDPLPGVDAEPFPNGWFPARLDLSMDLTPIEDGRLFGTVIYSTDLFDRETVERLVDRFKELLAAVVADPEVRVGSLRMLPDAELGLLERWNETETELPEVTLVDLLLEQAAATPDAVAAGKLTYAELAGLAAELAGRLAAAGIGRGSLVAIQMERGTDMLVALLGVAMSGAAYLPVDPDYPRARVSYVIEDSGAALVLTGLDDLPPGTGALARPRPDDLPPGAETSERPRQDHLPQSTGTPGRPRQDHLPQSTGTPERPRQDDLSPAIGVLGRPRPDDTAYVLYTSGSTGRPKGVVVSHRALTNFLLAMRILVGSSPRDVWLALTSLSFDISALELYLPLVTGGRVVVADAETARDGVRLARLVRDEGVTHVQATPSGWRVLLTGDLPRVVGLTGGEPLPPRFARELRPRVDRLVNVYGPTETTIWSTAWDVPENPGEVVIGRPIANTTVHVLDPAGHPCPIGVPGELLIGGAGVADGYLGRPALTAERFVPGPAGSRVYRTGDRARHRNDGTLEFLGRTDNQVKLRGHRIELGEIEAVLDAHPGVRQAVVAVRGDRLVAFAVPAVSPPASASPANIPATATTSPGSPAIPSSQVDATTAPSSPDSVGIIPSSPDDIGTVPSPPDDVEVIPSPDGARTARLLDELREHAGRELPGYMVPSVFVAVEALPLTPNGKIDRNALPEAGAGPERSVTPPRTPGERLVAQVFTEVLGEALGGSEVGAHDDFFTLGGHSLLATMVTARLTALSGVEVPVREVFLRPTAAGLAELIAGTGGGETDGSWPPTGAGGEETDGSPITGETDGSWPEPITGVRSGQKDGPRPRPKGVTPPLSYGQERLWFLNRLDPDDASYNMCLVRRLRGPLDRDALGRALDGTVARHESLRTRFPEVDGAPVVVIDPPGPVAVEETTATDEAEALERVAALTNTPFGLASRPPLRVTLIRIAEDDHVLCVTLHHILGDGWSLNLIFDELSHLYSGRNALPPVPLQFGDVARWQRERDTGDLIGYWRDMLADPTPLDLPVDRPRVAGTSRRGDVATIRLDAGEVAALSRLGREHGATMFMVLLAAYQVLLSRHTGQGDILVGAATAGRDRVQLEPVVGYLSDTLVLRGDLSADPTFSGLLRETQTRVLDAFSHQGVPFEELVTALRVERDLTRTPLFQTMIILHTQDSGRPLDAFAGLTTTGFDHGMRQAKLELMMEAWQDEHELVLTFVYDTELFDRATVEAMAARFRLLLTALPGASGDQISRLPLRTADDDALLLRLSEGPAQPAATAVRDLFAATVRTTPDAVAVECGDAALTYAELDARADELAALLRARGVVPGDVVGVCLNRSPDAVAALLATWRAGAAYLPLDPEHPTERLAFMLADSAASLVLTSADLTGRLPSTTPLARTADAPTGRTPGPLTGETPDPVTGEMTGRTPGPMTDRPADEVTGRTPDRVTGPMPGFMTDPVAGEVTAPGGEAAYVIYTSGSTGTPKGVVVEHRNLAARVAWMRQAYGLHPGDRVVQFASLSFDTHAEEIYPALAAGARLRLLPDGGVTLPDHLDQITVLDLPTAYWHALVDEIDEIAWPPALRLVILGGEQVHEAAVTRWRERFGDRIRLVNTYGPTEATIIATAATLDGSPGRPPIGTPIGGTRVLVLDDRGEPVPPGAPGELCIGGAGVARGYLGRPELTGERFPLLGRERVYRTGDRARWRADGQLEFLGREDGQVKVRGFRIELGEIEARLLAHPGVGQAAVAVHQETLVGYTVGTAGGEELARHLADGLPAYMVPAHWVSLDVLPLTSNGKLDRAALPAPVTEIRAKTAPRGDAEELVAEVFGEVLGIEGIGAFDDFFALGGHSLLATRVIARLRAAIEVDVPIRALFARSTVAGLAVTVEELLVAELSELSDEEAVRLMETGS